ncbi:mucin-3A-like [Nymphalis io]|uniref:mucin-3A-like n=1 Tax=Inachis io TaxID=171585 RepID=UPI0021675EF7|nr:mucin-3A-like [Nymphalis io]
MANRLLLCLVLVCVLTDYSLCGRFSSRSRSGGSSRSGSSWSWGGRSSSASKPSSSSSRHSYPSSSSSRLSGSGQSSHNYPSSSSGSSHLSGSGQSSHNYPSSSSGSSRLSGSGQSSHNYPSPSSGSSHLSGSGHPSPSSGSSILFGSGHSSHNYPSSISKLSGSSSGGKPAFTGTGSASKYPPSPSLSGSGSGSIIYPPSHGLSGVGRPVTSFGNQAKPTNVVKHNYPQSSSGLSGSVIQKPSHYNPSSSGTHINPPHSSVYTNTHSGFGSGYGYNSHNYYNSYASAPQHIYITEYRNSNSRYSDILTGLALYNLGRSNSHYNHHYYNDDYYTRRYYSSGNSHPSNERPIDEAYCTLRIKENNKLEVLKIPCEIVSTFTEGSKKLSPDIETKTVCVSNHTIINNTQVPTVTTTSTTSPLNMSSLKATISSSNKTTIPEIPANISTSENNLGIIPVNATNLTAQVEVLNPSTIVALTSITESTPASNTTAAITTNTTTILPTLHVITSTTSPSLPASQQDTVSTSTANPSNVVNNATLPPPVTSNITVINSTKCTTTTDPLTVKGPPLNPTNMECEVDIITKTNRLRTKVDCNILTEYSKLPEPPKKESAILPSRNKLKSWLANPPWWMSIFIAV